MMYRLVNFSKQHLNCYVYTSIYLMPFSKYEFIAINCKNDMK